MREVFGQLEKSLLWGRKVAGDKAERVEEPEHVSCRTDDSMGKDLMHQKKQVPSCLVPTLPFLYVSRARRKGREEENSQERLCIFSYHL